uniref:sigma-70 family RNA polymerase sigma factor n=1 Tax=Prevotella sp. TaxID=59823 RepID=UPI0040286398
MNEKENINRIVGTAYIQLRDSLITFVANRIGDQDLAKDICQDVFLRLLEYDMVSAETVTNLVYTIARHIVIDRIRHKSCSEKVRDYLWTHLSSSYNNAAHEVESHDLERLERLRIERLSPMRAKVYRLSRYEGKSTADIASALGISPRTAESHLFCARKEMRQFMRGCM